MEKKHFTLVMLLVWTAANAAAWGGETHKYICEQAVSSVWGVKTVKQCLVYNKTLQNKLCDQLLQSAGQEAYDRCLLETSGGVFLHPATIPDVLFNDTVEHCDYSICPVEGAGNQRLMCGDPTVKPAAVKSEVWLVKSMNADDLCLRIDFFCIASNYYSDSKFKLNNVRNLKMCYGDVEGDIDRLVRANDSWSIGRYCSFEGWVQYAGRTARERHSQAFTFTSNDIAQIIQNLSARARYINSIPLVSDITPETSNTRVPATLAETAASSTTVPAAPAANETQLLYQELVEQADMLLNESLNMLDILGNLGSTDGGQPRGQGNILIKAFTIFFVIVGFGIGAVVYIKTEQKRRKKEKPAEPPNPGNTQAPAARR